MINSHQALNSRFPTQRLQWMLAASGASLRITGEEAGNALQALLGSYREPLDVFLSSAAPSGMQASEVSSSLARRHPE